MKKSNIHHFNCSDNTKIAEDVLIDPIMMQKLCDRVYELWREEAFLKRERTQGYRRNI